jgi:protein pelota
VEKDAWDSVMLARLRESVADASERADLWAVLIRDGLAQLCVVTGGMTIVKARLETHIAKKGDARVLAGAKKQREHWFEQLLSAIIRHVRFDRLKCAVLAGPGFTKDAFWEWMCEQSTKRELRELLLSQPKWLLVHASSAYKHAIKEILGDPTVAQQVADTRAGREVKALADFMGYMAEQPDRVTYGLRFVQLAAEQGAIATLLLVDSLFRAQNIARRAEHVALAEAAEAAGATVLIFSDQHVSGAQLKQLSGVAALLRFPLPLDQLDELDGLDDDDKGDGGGSDEEASSSSSSSSTSDDERPTERPRAVQAHVAGDGPGAGGEHGGEASSERGWAVGDDGLREAGLEASATKLHVS